MNSLSTDRRRTLKRVVAVIGCDGSGKSTLTADLFTHLRKKGPAERIYLGQSSGEIANRIQCLPFVGTPFRRYLERKAERAHGKKTTAPDTLTVLVVFLLSLWRAYKFRRMLRFCRRGNMVITDRYPQAQTPGFHFDGPGLGAINTQSSLAKWLAAREQRLYEWMADHLPTLVIRLNVDANTAYVRKPDHSLATLQDKANVIPTLGFNGARILDLDGRNPYEQVLDSALNAVDAAIATP